MKTVAEKIILNYFGKFINGIHKDNLSVSLLSGNFQLQNISLNQQYFDSLNTPFRLTFSTIGKLNLQAPIAKLSSAPVECVLDSIYAVFEFRTDKNSEKQASVEKIFKDKKQSIQKYVRDMFEEYFKKLREKDEKKQDGMFAKLGKKIIDNLQLKVINLHVRFQQNKDNQKYAWGITLEQISFITTDNQWKPTFVDRLVQGKSEKLLKKMNLKNLSIYWQSGLKQKGDLFISQLQTNYEKSSKMSNMIKDSKYSIISLTSQVKLIINQSQNTQTPLYQLSVDLAPIKFQLQRAQVYEMIDFTKKNISQNQQILKNLSLKKKKSKKALEQQQKVKLEQTFHQYVQSIVDNHEATKQKVEIDQRFDQIQTNTILKAILNKVQDQQVLLWALKPIRNKVKQARQKQLKKKKKGWFGGQYQLTEEQTKTLSNFVQQVTQNNQNTRPPQSILFSLRVMIQGGKFAFINNKDMQQQQVIEFQIGKINVFLEKSGNDSIFDLNVGVEKVSLNLFLPIYGSDQRLKMNILTNLQDQQEQFFDPGQEQQKFISIKYSKRVQTTQKPIIKTDIIGEIKQIAVTYKKVFIKKFKSFFTFSNFNQQIKNQTIKKWQQITQKNQQKAHIEQQQNQVVKMFNIHVKITSPLFVCPLTQTGGWCINLGQLSLQSIRDNQKQIYPIKVQSAYFRYYPNLKDCLKNMNEKQLNERQVFCLVKDMNFNVTYINYLFVKKSKTDILLPNFEVNFTQKQYKNLISLKDVFQSDDSQSNFFQILKKQRFQVQKNRVYAGNIQKKSGQFDKWKTYYGILSGQFIHLYGSQKQLKCLQKIPIKNMRLQYDSQTKVINLAHQQGIIQIMGSQHQNNSKQWNDKISHQMKEFMTIYEIVQEMINQQKGIKQARKRTGSNLQNIMKNQRQKTVSFSVQKIGFNFKDQNFKDLMVFKLYGLSFEQKQLNKISNKLISIQKLQSFDYIHIYKDKSLQSLISINQIQIKVQRNKNDENKKFNVQINFSKIFINWKPDVLVILMKLVYSYLSKQIKHRVDDGQEKTRQQMFQQVLNDPKFAFSMKQYERNSQGRQVKSKRINFVQKNKRLKQLVRLNLTIGYTQVLMLHRQSHLIMFKMTGNMIKNQLFIGQNQKYVSGSIKSLNLYQMTGYPKVNYSETDVNKPYLIIKPRYPDSQQSLVQYKWSSYQPFVLPNAQRVNMFMHIVINPIQCHYFQQITFRLIDYILIQIILLLNQPEMVVANQNLLQQLKRTSYVSQNQAKKQSQSIVKILFSQFQQVIRKIVDPYFMDMYFELKNPSILLKPQKNSKFYHRADLDDIIFSNQDKKNEKRFQKCKCPQVMKYIYEQTYEINCNQCYFYSVEQQQNNEVSSSKIKTKQQLLFDPVDISLSVNKLIMQDQINVIYPELNTYDRSFYTSTNIQKLTIKKLTRQQYLLINKLVNYNMVYDDNKDEHFIHNFKITKLLSPKPIYYDLLIKQISLTGMEGNLNSDYKLFSVNMNGFKRKSIIIINYISFHQVYHQLLYLFGPVQYVHQVMQLKKQQNQHLHIFYIFQLIYFGIFYIFYINRYLYMKILININYNQTQSIKPFFSQK